MNNSKRINVYLRQRFGETFPHSHAQDAFESGARLTPKQRRRVGKKENRDELRHWRWGP